MDGCEGANMTRIIPPVTIAATPLWLSVTLTVDPGGIGGILVNTDTALWPVSNWTYGQIWNSCPCRLPLVSYF